MVTSPLCCSQVIQGIPQRITPRRQHIRLSARLRPDEFDVLGSLEPLRRYQPDSRRRLRLPDPNQSFTNSMHGGATPDGDTVVGFYVDMMTNHTHGYVLQDGVLQPYDGPTAFKPSFGTSILGKNWWELTKTSPENSTGFCSSQTNQRR